MSKQMGSDDGGAIEKCGSPYLEFFMPKSFLQKVIYP